MGIRTTLKYLKILIKLKINKHVQKNFVYIPKDQKSVLIRSYSELYAVEHVPEVALQINSAMAKDKDVLKKIVKYLIKKNKTIYLLEEERAFSDNDIKEFFELSTKIYLNQLYIEQSKEMAANQILQVDIVSYNLVIGKIDYFESECNKICSNEFEKCIYTIVQLSNYIKYVNTLNSKILNPCLINAFVLRNGVCIDFAVALWKCLDRLNIECKIIKGIANTNNSGVTSITLFDHAWNQVKIDNRWYNLDLTWFNSNKNCKFLLVNDESFYKENIHKTRFEKKTCLYNYDEKCVKNKIEEYEKLENVFSKYDKGKK